MTDITIKGSKEKSAVALGFFDGLHLGHIEVIQRAMAKRELCSVIFTFNDKTMLP
ncbi:MAG: adenylyltransferase/cytidyltransferase family protein, partial [Ruminiclostridium sp.]|nr:adenylyltransferase/cytidyltransferase family protein [Ruminiclostridium sp.]